MAETNVELARRGYAAVLRGDLDVIRHLLDPGVKWHGGDPSAAGARDDRGGKVVEMVHYPDPQDALAAAGIAAAR
jgi:hypothetical protein